MNVQLRKLVGAAGIGLSWGVVWSAVFAVMVLIIGIVRPEDIDPGEGPLRISGFAFVVGSVSGVIFGLILSLAERRRQISKLGVIRAAIWGALASAVWPLLTPAADSMVIIFCPLGATCALVFVAIARRLAPRDSTQSTKGGLIGRFLANSLQAVCASKGDSA